MIWRELAGISWGGGEEKDWTKWDGVGNILGLTDEIRLLSSVAAVQRRC